MIHFDIKETCDALLEKMNIEKKTQLIMLSSFIIIKVIQFNILKIKLNIIIDRKTDPMVDITC